MEFIDQSLAVIDPVMVLEIDPCGCPEVEKGNFFHLPFAR
jgi:hypothetical protein